MKVNKLIKCLAGVSLFLLLSGCSLKPVLPYTPTEKALLGVVLVGQAGDYVSTVSKFDEGCREANPLLGNRPDQSTLLLAKIAVGSTVYFVGNSLGHGGRKILFTTAGIVGVGTTVHNLNLECN